MHRVFVKLLAPAVAAGLLFGQAAMAGDATSDGARMVELKQSTARIEFVKNGLAAIDSEVEDLWALALDVEDPRNAWKSAELFMELQAKSSALYVELRRDYPEVYALVPPTPPHSVAEVNKLKDALWAAPRRLNAELVKELTELKALQGGGSGQIAERTFRLYRLLEAPRTL
jgi:hypothetical protein